MGGTLLQRLAICGTPLDRAVGGSMRRSARTAVGHSVGVGRLCSAAIPGNRLLTVPTLRSAARSYKKKKSPPPPFSLVPTDRTPPPDLPSIGLVFPFSS